MKKPLKPKNIKRIILLAVNLISILVISLMTVIKFNARINLESFQFYFLVQGIFTTVTLIIYYFSIIADAFDRAYRDFEDEDKWDDKDEK